MTTKKKSLHIKGKFTPREFFRQGTKKLGGREATPRDIARNREAVPPKTPDPIYQKGTSGKRWSYKNSIRQYRPNGQGKPTKRGRPPRKSGQILKTRSRGSRHQVPQTTADPPPMTSEIRDNWMETPQEQRGDPQDSEWMKSAPTIKVSR